MPDSIVTAYEESDVLDPRTDAVRPSVPPVMKPVDLGPVHVETPVVLSPMAGGGESPPGKEEGARRPDEAHD